MTKQLTAGQREVVLLLAVTGAPNQQLANALGISRKAVRDRLGHAYRTLGIDGYGKGKRLWLLRWAWEVAA